MNKKESQVAVDIATAIQAEVSEIKGEIVHSANKIHERIRNVEQQMQGEVHQLREDLRAITAEVNYLRGVADTYRQQSVNWDPERDNVLGPKR